MSDGFEIDSSTLDRSWLPMALAPRDRRIEIQAERWTHQGERRRVEAFARCKWCAGGTCRNPGSYWRGLPTGWTATHWREAADEAAAVRQGADAAPADP